MKRELLRVELKDWLHERFSEYCEVYPEDADDILMKVDTYVAEVIGELEVINIPKDADGLGVEMEKRVRNMHRREQRHRAGFEEGWLKNKEQSNWENKQFTNSPPYARDNDGTEEAEQA